MYLYDFQVETAHNDHQFDVAAVAAEILALPQVLDVVGKNHGEDCTIEMIVDDSAVDVYAVVEVAQAKIDATGHATWGRGGGGINPQIRSFADLEAAHAAECDCHPAKSGGSS